MNANHDETSQGHTELVKPHRSDAGQGEVARRGADSSSGARGSTVQDPAGPAGAKPSTPTGGLGPAAIITAIALIAVYIAMLFVLMSLRNDAEWDRLVYLLSGFEALVFAGAGALFGTTIQRANVNAARNDAADAKKDAADANQKAQSESVRAQDAEKDAAAGRFLAAAVKTKADTRASGAPGQSGRVRGSRPESDLESTRTGPAGTGPAGLDADLAELSALARTILPD